MVNVNRPAKKPTPTISKRLLATPNTIVVVGISKLDELVCCGFVVCSTVDASDIVRVSL